MKALSVAGTIAMFLVGGGILTHGFPIIQRWVDSVTAGQNGFLSTIISLSTDALTGIVAGALVLGTVTLFSRLRQNR